MAGSIEPELLKTESGAVATRSPADMTGWDLVRQGMWYFHKVTRETHLRACELFRTAVKLDPQLPEAHAWLAYSHHFAWLLRGESPSLHRPLARQASLRAVTLEPVTGGGIEAPAAGLETRGGEWLPLHVGWAPARGGDAGRVRERGESVARYLGLPLEERGSRGPADVVQ